jgi:hypothetical protein
MDISRIKHLAGLTEAPIKYKKQLVVKNKIDGAVVSLSDSDKMSAAIALAIVTCIDQYGGPSSRSNSEIKDIINSGTFTIELMQSK